VFIVTKIIFIDSKRHTENPPDLSRSSEVPKWHALSLRFRNDRLQMLLCGVLESGAARRMRMRKPVELLMEKAGGGVAAGDVAEKGAAECSEKAEDRENRMLGVRRA
jgi:hypothetical protein